MSALHAPSLFALFLAASLLLLLLPFPPVPRAHADGDGEGNPCAARTDGGGVGLCPVKCFRPDPVCGEDGVTYWCGCTEAACAGARVAKRGFCPVSNGGSDHVSGQAFLLVHTVWLIVLGFAVLLGFL